MFAKRLETLANRLLAKRLVDETSTNRYKGGALTRALTLLLAVAKDLAFFRLVTNRKAARVLSRIYRLGEKSRVTEGHELRRGVRGHAPPRKFFETQFLEMLQCMCTDLVASGWFFWYSYLYTVLITIYLRGKLGIWGGGGSFYPSNTRPNKIWTSEHLFGVAGCPTVF